MSGIPSNLSYAAFDLIGGGQSTSSTVIQLTTVPQSIPTALGPSGEIIYLEPPLWYQWKFTQESDGFECFTNWIGVNTDNHVLADPRQNESWNDDLIVVPQTGVVFNLIPGLPRLNRS